MYRPIVAGAIFSLIGHILTISVQAQETGFTEIERELHYISKLWPGDYDNQEQLSFDARAKREKTSEQERFHAFVKRIDIPALGEFVFYSEEHKDADQDNIYRQYVYVLSADESHSAVRLTPFLLRKPETISFPYGHDTARLKLSRRNLKPLIGCDYLLRRDSEKFIGTMENQSCDDGSDIGLLQREISLSKDTYTFKERRVSVDGKTLSAVNDFEPRYMKRARWFACMVDVPKETPNRSNHTQHYIKIHDQGGEFDIAHPDGRNMKLTMRNTWSYGMQRETFFIGIFEATTPLKLLVYSWGMPGSDRIGMNPGYIRIQCDLDTPENVELQQGLRTES